MRFIFGIAICALPSLAFAAPIRVAVLDGGVDTATAGAVADQLNDDTWFDFDAVLVNASTLSSAADLVGYDAVVMGSSGSGSSDKTYSAGVSAAVTGFNATGGGVVSSSWMSYEDPNTNIDAFVPIVQSARTSDYCTGPTAVSISRTVVHPIIDGVANFTDSSTYWEAPGPAARGAVVLASCGGGKPAVTALESSVDAGRQAYLGGIYFGLTSYRNEGLRTGAPDRLFEQAVAWAAGGCEDLDGDGVSTCAADCDDDDPLRFPGNVEACDGIDNDCDDVVPANEADDDIDGERICAGDCDDNDELRFSANPEVCDGIDNDCDDVVPADELDGDNDGFSACELDCDDADPDAFPGNPEVCDEIDNDCNDSVDDGLERLDYYPDGDSDGWGDKTASATPSCAQLDGFVKRGGDCDDSDPSIHPEAPDVPENGIDEDCDGADLIRENQGCGCQSTPTGSALWLLMMPALLVWRRRKNER